MTNKTAIDNMAAWYETNSTSQPSDHTDPMQDLKARRDSQAEMSPMEKLTLGFSDLQEAEENVTASTSTEEEGNSQDDKTGRQGNETDAETTTEDSTASGTEEGAETSTADAETATE